MDNQNIDREFSWDDVIENEGGDWVLLPEGDYDFEITGFERARHTGSPKLPPCNKAVISVHIDSPQGSTTITHNLFLHSKCEGMLSAFFIGIGQKKHGEPLRMNWQNVIGAKGHCKIGIRTWKGKDGEDKQSNEIKKFYDPQPNDNAANQPAVPTNQPSGIYTPGKF